MLDFDATGKEALNKEEVQSIRLYELYYSETEEPLRFTSWDEEVAWQGNVYQPNVIKNADITFSADGQVNNVNLTVGNVDRIIQYYIEQYDLTDKKVRIIEIFAGTTNYIPATFRIKAIRAKADYVTFILSLGFDFLLAEVPSRKMFARFCAWQFKGADGNCPYTGADEVCDHTFEACKAKGCLEKIGCFPAIINDRIYF